MRNAQPQTGLKRRVEIFGFSFTVGSLVAFGGAVFVVVVVAIALEVSALLKQRPKGYRIDLEFSGTVTSKEAFREAADMWTSILEPKKGKAVRLEQKMDLCGFGKVTLPKNTVIEGITLLIVEEPDDGPGLGLAAAGPCVFFEGFALTGVILLDSEDAALLAQEGVLVQTLFHEMGHALGWGTLNAPHYFDYETAFTIPYPVIDKQSETYNGTSAVEVFESWGYGDKPPVAPRGTGPGTAYSHWAEDFFTSELMTGFVDGSNYVSEMTVKSMKDMGFEIQPGVHWDCYVPSQPARTDCSDKSILSASARESYLRKRVGKRRYLEKEDQTGVTLDVAESSDARFAFV